MKSKILLATLLCLYAGLTQAQTSSNKFNLKVDYEKYSNARKPVPKQDSITINFDYGYNKDIIKIKTQSKMFLSDTLIADDLYGFAGAMKVPKSYLKGPIRIYFNDTLLAEMKVNTKYSSIHLQFDRETNRFIWRYHRYKFSYL